MRDPGRGPGDAHEVQARQSAASRRRPGFDRARGRRPPAPSPHPEHITVVVGHQAEQVRAAACAPGVRFANKPNKKAPATLSWSAATPLASQDGLLVVLYGDCPLLSSATLQALVDRQAASSAAATLITTRARRSHRLRPHHLRTNERAVQAIVEHKAATPEQLRIRFINSGIYCFQADLLWKHSLEIRPDNPAHEYYSHRYRRDPEARRPPAWLPWNVDDSQRAAGHQHARRTGRGRQNLPRAQGPAS